MSTRVLGTILPIAGLLVVSTPSHASATNSSANLAITTFIPATCVISAGSALPPYDAPVISLSAPLLGAGAIRTACTDETNAVITLTQRTAGVSTGPGEIAGSDRTTYALPPDSNRTFVWGAAREDAPTARTRSVLLLDRGARASGADRHAATSEPDTVIATVTF